MRKIFETATGLSCVDRYSQSHLTKPENVLEHTGFVALCAFAIYNRMSMAGEVLDIGTILQRAVLHDIDEIITGDIPRPTKYANEALTSAMKEYETKNMLKLSADVFRNMTPFNIWEMAKDDTKEGFIIHITDAFAVVWKAWHEGTVLGNKSITGHIDAVKGNMALTRLGTASLFKYPKEMDSIIDEVMEIADEILGKRHSVTINMGRGDPNVNELIRKVVEDSLEMANQKDED